MAGGLRLALGEERVEPLFDHGETEQQATVLRDQFIVRGAQFGQLAVESVVDAVGGGGFRRKLVEADLVDCIVALPGQIFYATQIPAFSARI